MQCTQLATQTSVIPLNLRLIVHLSSFADNLWEIKKKLSPKLVMSCSMVSGGKHFLALTPDPIWSLTPPEFISRPCLPESRGRHVNVDHVTLCTFTMVTCAPSEPATHQRCHHRRRCRCSTSLFRIKTLPPGKYKNVYLYYALPCFDPNNPNKAKLILGRWWFL